MKESAAPFNLSHLLDQCSLPMLAVDKELMILWKNDALENLLQLPETDPSGLSLNTLMKDLLSPADLHQLSDTIKHHTTNQYESLLLHEKRKWIRWEISYNNQSFYSLIVLHDITEEIKTRRLTELSQKLSEEYLTHTNANDYFNDILSLLLDVTQSEYGFMGEVFYEYANPYLKTYAITNISWNKETSDFYNQYAPTGMEFRNLHTLFGHAMLSKQPMIANQPATHPHKGGTPPGHPPLNAFLGIPVLLSNGDMVGLIGLANRPGGYHEQHVEELRLFLELFGAIIQSKKNAEEKRIIQTTLKDTLFEKDAILKALNTSTLVSVTDLEGKLLNVNTLFCKASGYSEEELVGQTHTLLSSGTHPKEFWTTLWSTISKGKSWRNEICNKHKNGDLFWVDTSINPIFDTAGNIIQFLSISSLITQRKEFEKQLAHAKNQAEASLRTKRRFLANISHEIRTPLHAILGVSEQIISSMPESGSKEQVKLVNDSANVLLNIINDVIDISRMEEGKMKLDQVSFDLKQVVESIFKLLEAYASQKNLGFELNFDPALNQIVKGDPVRLRQVLINILGNAIKFTENGRVRLICKPVFTHDHKIQVSFVCEDTGVGISDEMKKRLFQDFSQEDESFQRKFGGSGLGLAITNELIKLMDGTIQIDSEKNMGTQVHILLPFSTNHVIDAPVIEKIPIDKDKLKKIKVLIAEDNQFNRVLLQVIFNKNEIYNDMAVNGLEAYNLCMNNDYDIILMDIQMPEMDGLEAMRKIRADKSNRIPIIAVTANAIQEELKFYMDEGFNDFITKPFTEEALLVKMLSFT